MGEQRPFGQCRCPGGVKEEADIIPFSLVYQFLEEARLLLIQFSSQLLDLLEADEDGIIVVPHPLWVIPDDFGKLGALILYGQGLIDLFLSLGKIELGIGVIDDVLNLIHQAVLKEPHPDAAGTHGRHLGPESFGAIIADHDRLVALLQPQGDQPQGKGSNVFQVFLPCVGNPDTELLLPHGHLLVPEFFGITEEEFRYG